MTDNKVLTEDERLQLALFFAHSAGAGFRGFSKQKRTEVAHKAAIASKASGKSHRYTPAEAKVAGSKGGRASKPGFRAWPKEKQTEVAHRAGLAAQASPRAYVLTDADRARAAVATRARHAARRAAKAHASESCDGVRES